MNQRPRKRLLQDLNRLSEELDIIGDIISEQLDRGCDYCVVNDPKSFQVTTPNRMSLYQLEDELASVVQGDMLAAHNALIELLGKTERLSQQTQQSVEIQQEDHGKAILAFTVVTIIFLPLSFVTGLFGMNTVDIRNSDHTQWIFWAIAIPLTVVVMIATLTIGYRADSLHDALESLVTRKRSAANVWFRNDPGTKMGDNENVSLDASTDKFARGKQPLPGRWKRKQGSIGKVTSPDHVV